MNLLAKQKGNLFEELALVPISDEMMSVAGSNTDEEGVRAIRMLSVMQAREIIEKNLRNEFTDFYKGEIAKARKMGMQLSKE